jgi:hypothetical protein
VADSESLDVRAPVATRALVIGLVAAATVASCPVAHAGGPPPEMTLDSRHLVPRTLHAGILINVPQRRLFLFDEGRLVGHYPVGGRGCAPPSGRYRIAEKGEGPAGSLALGRLPGGALHRCLALQPDDTDRLYRRVEVGSPVEVVYQPVILGQEGGAYLLEVHPDARGTDPLVAVRAAASRAGIAEWLDWDRVRAVAARREGVAREVTRLPGTAVAALWGVR